jgi:S-adenosylmethionine hydrolase
MSDPIITLTTDFGVSSPYVAQMKGVILSLNRDVKLVDITHAIPPQDVKQGARVLEEVCDAFPTATIHVAVVDPGVGTDRRIVCCQMGRQFFVAPDNGLLSRVRFRSPPSLAVALTNREYWLGDVSDTFHGRDIMAPAAAHLSLGLDPRRLGELVDELVELDWPRPSVSSNEIMGSIVSCDAFGNLITDISASLLDDPRKSGNLVVHCRGCEITQITRTYGKSEPGMIVGIIGSSRMLEISVVNGNAVKSLGAELGDAVRVRW